MIHTHDPLQPDGHRLLVQSLDHDTADEFRVWIYKVFGQAKGRACRIVAGFHGPPDGTPARRQLLCDWVWRKAGFRAYLRW